MSHLYSPDQQPVSSNMDEQMTYEESNNQRKKKMENFNPRPGQPLLSDLHNQTTSGAPLIIHLISNPQSFNLLSLTEKKQFISNLTHIVGQV